MTRKCHCPMKVIASHQWTHKLEDKLVLWKIDPSRSFLPLDIHYKHEKEALILSVVYLLRVLQLVFHLHGNSETQQSSMRLSTQSSNFIIVSKIVTNRFIIVWIFTLCSQSPWCLYFITYLHQIGKAEGWVWIVCGIYKKFLYYKIIHLLTQNI